MADKPRITESELMKNLVSARKIMNKVDTGDYEKGNINEDLLRSDPEELAGVLLEWKNQSLQYR